MNPIHNREIALKKYLGEAVKHPDSSWVRRSMTLTERELLIAKEAFEAGYNTRKGQDFKDMYSGILRKAPSEPVEATPSQ